jgi:hypothetical protein
VIYREQIGSKRGMALNWNSTWRSGELLKKLCAGKTFGNMDCLV